MDKASVVSSCQQIGVSGPLVPNDDVNLYKQLISIGAVFKKGHYTV